MRKLIPARPRIRRILRDVIIGYTFLLGFLVIMEPHLVYQPFKGPSDPVKAGLKHFTLQSLEVEAAPPIIYWEHRETNARQTVFYFHGNGAGLFGHTGALAFLAEQHFNVIAMEYPGYPSGAEGSPSEAVIIANAKTLYRHITQRYPNQKYAIWGVSLGTGVATQLAADQRASALVLEAPFTAAVDRARELYPMFPVRQLMRNTYRSRDYIGNVHAPLFIMHGTQDNMIPMHHGRDLFALANQPKEFHEYAGFGHNNLIQSMAYKDAAAFIRLNGKH